MPMPYDINITANGAGTKDVSYTAPGKSGTLTVEEYNAKKPIHELVAKLLESQIVREVQPSTGK